MSFTGDELERLIPRLRRYAHALARPPVMPDDLIQDTLERAWSHRRRWQRGTDLRAWLFTILHNVFISEMRRIASRDALSVPSADPSDDADLRSTGLDDQPGLMLDIERALAALPEDQRAVVLLVGLEDLRYRQAAEILGIPVGTVMSRLARGRMRLRELMDGGPTVRRGSAMDHDDAAVRLRIVR